MVLVESHTILTRAADKGSHGSSRGPGLPPKMVSDMHPSLYGQRTPGDVSNLPNPKFCSIWRELAPALEKAVPSTVAHLCERQNSEPRKDLRPH